MIVFTTLTGGSAVQAVVLTAEEQQVANYLTTASEQTRNRAVMHADARLVAVARARAADMARRNYVAHVNPDGNGPNYLVRATGYVLPAWWGTDRAANYIESLGVGYTSASGAWTALMASPQHRTHLLALDAFYRDQTSFGVGHYYDASSPYRHYWVIITAPPSDPPTLTMSAPAASAKVTTSSVVAKGTVSGAEVFAHLQYRLDTPAGQGEWTEVALPAGKTVAAWSASVSGLAPGMNTIRARTLETSGATVKEIARSVKLIIVKPLTVNVDGPGKVSDGFLGASNRELGLLTGIVATPAAGFIFDHWDGLPDAPTRDIYKMAQSFVMAEGLVITAHFIVSPYIALASSFRGLIGSLDGTHARSGQFVLTLTRGGGFSGAITFGGRLLAVSGRLNSLGNAAVSVPRPGLSALQISLHLDATGADPALHGVLNDGAGDIEFSAGRNQSAPVLPGRYNVGIAPDAAAPGTPQGFGYGMIALKADGTATVTGVLANGAAFTAVTHYAGDRLVFYKALYLGEGSLSGSLALGADTASGTVRFHKPARSAARYYAGAYRTTNEVGGSRYTAPVGAAPVVQFAPDSTAGSLALAAGDLATAVEQPFTVGAGGTVRLPANLPLGWKLNINPATGRYTGKFVHSSGSLRTFSGVVSQQDRVGWGFFLGTSASGAATLGALL